MELGPEDERAVIPEYGFGPPYFFRPPDQRMRDVPKLLIFQTDQEPQWSGLAADVQRLLLLDGFVTGPIAWVAEHPYSLDRQQQLAYSLFHASYFENNEETRHILLVTAIEAMLPPKGQLPSSIVGVIDTLKARLEELDDPLNDNTRDRVAKLLEDSKFEGIARRGRRLVGILGTERFSDDKPKDYFMRMYDWRSALVHGNLDRPTYVELDAELRELRRFVLALLDQIPERGAIRLTTLRPTVVQDGMCDLCGDALADPQHSPPRCERCGTAARLALGYLSLFDLLCPGG